METDATAMHGAALDYARRGWRTFPLHTVHHGRCTCGQAACTSPGKHPRVDGWQIVATTEPARIEFWARRWPASNLATVTGNGLLVLDEDGPDGADSLAHYDLPDTPVVLTGRGRHFYMKTDHVITNKADLLPGVDLRGDGGYVVAPPSRHVTGHMYTWDLTSHVEDVPLAPVPRWLLDLIGTQPVRPPSATSGTELELRMVDGARNHLLFRFLCGLRGKGLGCAALRDVAQTVNRHHVEPPLELSEVELIVASVLRYEPNGAPEFDVLAGLCS